MSRDWLIVDAPNMVWRAFYSVGNKEALPSVLLAVHEIERLAAEYQITDIAFAFDVKPYKRREMFEGYKAGRDVERIDDSEQDAIDQCRQRISRLGTDYLAKLGYQNSLFKRGFEADDMLAAAVAGLTGDDRAILVSADRDLYQLLSRKCAVYHPTTDRFVTAAGFRAEYGIDPDRWAEVKAVAGCSSDDVPGVRGVGELTAIKILTKRFNRMHRAAYDVHEFLKTPEYERNLKLTTLPFPGCPEVELTPDPPRRRSGFRQLCEALDMQRLADAMENHETIGALINGQ